ncbi:MAG: tRNA glutamyl-Q(34) synthetase GluQRS [Alphaproteobacteria bacterium]|nr:tRNA glutamyl-Q(34) synthetase GluQRS [Alphaproteobacteria bacterium]
MTGVVTRFAPSPTGLLHLGHAYAAGFAAQQAGKAGRFLLRIEDIDPTRCQTEFITAIYEDLQWLGLHWLEPVLRQSHNFPAYRSALAQLKERGLLYPCFCTRKTIETEIAAAGHAPHGPEGTRYPRLCHGFSAAERQERIDAGLSHCWRLDMPKAIEQAGPLTWHDAELGHVKSNPADFGDIILARKETPAAYHLAVVVDDAAQGVTLVTRGRDLLRATDVHRLLQALLGLPYPQYHHHKLMTDSTGKRYAKRDQSATLRALRQKGIAPVTIWQELALIVA